MKKSYYVIRGTKYGGLFSHYIRALSEIRYALEKGRIPIVDMMTYPNMYLCDENVNRMNAWEFFFRQPCGISMEEISDEDDVLFCDKPHLSTDPLTTPRYFEWLNSTQTKWHDLRKQYLRLSDHAVQAMNAALLQFERPENALGVLCRGSDYAAIRPHGHPVQPTVEEAIAKTKEFLDHSDYRSILLSSEDSAIRERFCKIFGSNVIVIGKAVKYTGEGYLSNDGISQNERIESALNYLSAIMMLSRCRGFICGKTCGSLGVMLQDHHFESLYVFELGVYP